MNKYLFMIVLLAAGALAVDVTVNNLDPLPAEAGKVVNVWFKVDNPDLDQTEQNVVLEIDPQDNLELAEGEVATKRVGSLAPGASQIVQYRLFVQDNAFKGSHIIEAMVMFDGGSFKKDLSIEVTDKDYKEVDLTVGDIESEPARIKPDDDNVKIDITILNLGDGRAQGVVAELSALPQGVTTSESYSGTSLLGNIEADGTAVATFYLDIDKETIPKEYQTTIKVSYKYKPDEEENDFVFEEKSIPLRLAIKPIPLYEITDVAITPESLTAGDDNVELKLTIQNVGDEEGESVRVKAFLKSEQPFSFEKSSDFVAPSLEPGESGQATLVFDIDDDAALQDYYLDLEIKNIVNNDVITYNEKILVKVKNPLPNNPWKYVIAGAIVTVVVIVGLAARSRSSRKPKKAKGKYGESYLEK